MTKAEKIALLQNLDRQTLDYFFKCFLVSMLKKVDKILIKRPER